MTSAEQATWIQAIAGFLSAIAGFCGLIISVNAHLRIEQMEKSRIEREESRRRQQSEQEMQRERERAYSIAVAIYPDLSMIDMAVNRASSIIDNKLQNQIAEFRNSEKSQTPQFIANVFSKILSEAKIEIPAMIQMHMERLHWLPGEAAAELNLLVFTAQHFNQAVDRCIEQMTRFHDEKPEDYAQTLKDHLREKLKIVWETSASAHKRILPIYSKTANADPA